MVTRKAKGYIKQGAIGSALLLITILAIKRHNNLDPGKGRMTQLQGKYGSLQDTDDSYSIDGQEIRAAHRLALLPQEDKLNILRQDIYKLPRPSDEKYAINETRSQNISVRRDIPDTRPDECIDIKYNIQSLPTISVIIPMYNEAPSILLRTIHSFLSRTPSVLLADIIVVDDMSTNENMKQVLTDYIDQLSPVVRLLRLKKKAHLIKARMAGASVARGDVLYFQDGHTEVNIGWSEPVLHYIKHHRNTIVQPAVENIDQWSIEYERKSTSNDMWRGVFLWDMRYAWHRTPEIYKIWQSSRAAPYPCPVLVGCSIAVDKGYFNEIGGFDTGLDIWGGEQIELSFRAWMCGGRVVIHPCARSGHIFKPWMKSDLNWKAREEAIAKNNIRIGESWMESYATYYYASNRIYDFKWVDLNDEEKSGVLERRRLKEDLKCKSFDWYLENVLPELKPPPTNARYHGEVKNERSEMCLTALGDGYIGLTIDCWTYSRLQHQAEFTFRDDGQMMYGSACVIVNGANLLHIVVCDEIDSSHGRVTFNQMGAGQNSGLIIYRQNGYEERCLEQVTNILDVHYRQQMPQFSKCNKDNRFQWWQSNYHFEYSLVPNPLFEGDRRF